MDILKCVIVIVIVVVFVVEVVVVVVAVFFIALMGRLSYFEVNYTILSYIYLWK